MDHEQKEYNGLVLPGAPEPHRRAGGVIVIDGNVVADTLQCVHCGAHWIPVKGSGRVRGWCLKCGGPFCGAACAPCLPFEKRLDLFEKGKRPCL